MNIVISDLDGTLLHAQTYSFDAAQPALQRLRKERIPLVLCSSKTRAEVERLLGTIDPAKIQQFQEDLETLGLVREGFFGGLAEGVAGGEVGQAAGLARRLGVSGRGLGRLLSGAVVGQLQLGARVPVSPGTVLRAAGALAPDFETQRAAEILQRIEQNTRDAAKREPVEIVERGI